MKKFHQQLPQNHLKKSKLLPLKNHIQMLHPCCCIPTFACGNTHLLCCLLKRICSANRNPFLESVGIPIGLLWFPFWNQSLPVLGTNDVSMETGLTNVSFVGCELPMSMDTESSTVESGGLLANQQLGESFC